MRRSGRYLVIAVSAAVITWQLLSAKPLPIRAELPTTAPAAARGDQLIIEPDAGLNPIDALLASAHRSLDLTMYELADPQVEAVLANDASRGVVVRVVLDHRLEAGHNLAAYDFLRARGIEVRWSSSRFFATHEKAFVIDGRTAVVMSLNLTARYYATSRDVAVVDRDPQDAAAIESVFAADFAGRSIGTPAADDLVWSPGQSQADLVALIDSARHSVAVESEELSSVTVLRALAAAARRGVTVAVAMTYNAAAVPGFNAVAAAGGRVSVLHGETPVYVHAKLLAIDVGTPSARAFVGSENLANSSLLHDRELGIVLLKPGLIDQIASTINTDLSSGQPWP